ncbi:MAG: DNA alkylation repair protein [Burkholderiales bacterium]
MAEPLKNQYGPDIPRRIAGMIKDVHPSFPEKAFLQAALRGYERLELMDRGRHIAKALGEHLPQSFPTAAKIVVKSMGHKVVPLTDQTERHNEGGGMGAFLFMPHAMFVASYGLDHFEESMAAQYEITQRFTAEFSIRPFIERYPSESLTRLRQWTDDDNHHVRRLVSEGTRPRLPWAGRLRSFQRDPSPVIALLERLKDDPSPYVRRSVANNLNDIGKDHPRLLTDIAARWMKDASPEREWIVRHALRSAVKRGDKAALAVLGFGGKNNIDIKNAKITPKKIPIGGSVVIAFDVANNGKRPARAMVDFAVHFVKANGEAKPKVFKLTALELRAGEAVSISKKVALIPLTTRKHYPGRHAVTALVNGETHPLGAFTLSE